MKDESKKSMVSYIGDGRDVDGPQSVTSRLNWEESRCLGIQVSSRSSHCARTYLSDLMGPSAPSYGSGWNLHTHRLKKSSSSIRTCGTMTRYMLSTCKMQVTYAHTTAEPYRYTLPDHLRMHALTPVKFTTDRSPGNGFLMSNVGCFGTMLHYSASNKRTS